MTIADPSHDVAPYPEAADATEPTDATVSLSPRARAIAAALSDRPISRSILAGMTRLIDAALIILTGAVALVWRSDPGEIFTPIHVTEVLVGAALAILYMQAFDGYDSGRMRGFFAQFGRIVASWTLVFATLLTATLVLGRGQIVGSPWATAWFGCGVAALALSRVGLAILVGHWAREGRLERRAVIVGGGRAAEDLIRALEVQPDNDIRICGLFDDRSGDRSPDIVAGYPKLGNVAELVAFARLAKIDTLIVTVPMTAERRILELMTRLWVLPVDIRLSAHNDRLHFRPRSYAYVGAVPFIPVQDKPLADWDAVGKRAFDLFFGTLLLVLFSPVMLATALAVKLDSRGPVFFRQTRYGFNNEPVEMWKFRSMYVDRQDAHAEKLVTRGDPRVTRVGRFIRRTSLDELPQLFNVLGGSLSLVGPRPHALAAKAENLLYEQVVAGYFARHKVKPGVTGWAQVNGWRGETDTAEKIQKRVEYDLYYIENWSLALDLKILLLTPFSLLMTRNAY